MQTQAPQQTAPIDRPISTPSEDGQARRLNRRCFWRTVQRDHRQGGREQWGHNESSNSTRTCVSRARTGYGAGPDSRRAAGLHGRCVQRVRRGYSGSRPGRGMPGSKHQQDFGRLSYRDAALSEAGDHPYRFIGSDEHQDEVHSRLSRILQARDDMCTEADPPTSAAIGARYNMAT
jgi:hypothetical protein